MLIYSFQTTNKYGTQAILHIFWILSPISLSQSNLCVRSLLFSRGGYIAVPHSIQFKHGCQTYMFFESSSLIFAKYGSSSYIALPSFSPLLLFPSPLFLPFSTFCAFCMKNSLTLSLLFLFPFITLCHNKIFYPQSSLEETWFHLENKFFSILLLV